MTETTAGAEVAGAQPSRRLAAIMFTDLVGYSALAHRDEALAIELLELHRVWVREILPRHGGVEIETVGDAFLIEFAGALAAVECAVAILRRFAEHNAAAPATRRMQLRVGIHLGDIEHKAGKVMGDGVNIASRIHGMAEPGAICVSAPVQQAVRNRVNLPFTSLGTPALKNITTPLELFQLTPAGKARRRLRLPSPRALLAAGIAAAVTLGVAWWAARAPPAGPPAIAVLPFENLSAEPDSAYFTDGLHDTVIGHLSRVAGLKVISRTSVMGYRGKQQNLRRIARELGADHILEGSVQRAGGRLRVAAQLIETTHDTHVWSHEYDRDLKDVFAVQADIAQSVASAVHAKLTPQEQARIESVPTTHPAAYDLYLRAVLVDRKVDQEPGEIRDAIGWLEQAIALDPRFAHAQALLASMHDALYWHGYDPTPERRARVGQAADAALALAPGLAEAHVAKARFLYHGSLDYAGAIAELEIARTLAPGSALVHFWLGPIYRRQGRWDDALASLTRAASLDPLNAAYLSEYAATLQMLRRYAEAEQALQRLVRVAGDDPLLAMLPAYNQFLWRGAMQPMEQALARVPAGLDPGCQVTGTRVGILVLQRRFDDAFRAGSACKEKFLPGGQGAQVPIEYHIAHLQWLAGGRRPTRAADQARAMLEEITARRPDEPWSRMNLAAALAMGGDHARALAETDRALAAMPLSRDALSGVGLLVKAAEIHANAGAEDRAIEELERAIRLPGGVHAHELKLDPIYDGLRGKPRFERLIEANLPRDGV